MQYRDQVIQHLTQHLGELEARRNRLVQEVEKEIEHVRATIASLKTTPLPATDHSQIERAQLIEPTADFPVAKIRNMTQVQALVTIAKHNNGTIRAQEAKRLLIRAGVMRETKNSTNITHNAIIRSEKFDRIGPGRFRLREFSPKADAAQHLAAVQ